LWNPPLADGKFIVGFLFFTLLANSAGAIPTAKDIELSALAVRQTFNTFIEQSRELRFTFELEEKFIKQANRSELNKLARAASDKIQLIQRQQQSFKKLIEEYQGDDWDDKFGSTKLWRKLQGQIYFSGLSGCQIDYYQAIASEQGEREKICHDILGAIETLGNINKTVHLNLIKAKVLGLLAKNDSAKKEFNKITSLSLRAKLEEIKFLKTSTGLDTFAERIIESGSADDYELVLSLAFLQRRYAPDALEQTFSLWPQVQSYMAELLLSHIIEKPIEKINVLDAQIAIAGCNRIEQYGDFLDRLSKAEKFQTPLILYTTAAGRSVELLLLAAQKQRVEKSWLFDMDPNQITAVAARLAHSNYADGLIDCQLAMRALEQYSQGDDLEYFYTIVLADCGKDTLSNELLTKIVADRKHKWSKQARFELLSKELKQKQTKQAELVSKCKRGDRFDRAGSLQSR
jgi:hypothetical protein